MRRILITLALLLTSIASAQDFKWWITKDYKNAWTIHVSDYDNDCTAIKIFAYRNGIIVDSFTTTSDYGYGSYHTDPIRLKDIEAVRVKCIRKD